MDFYTSDEHYGHKNIIRFCNRPFSTLYEMEEVIINRNNELVKAEDTVVHAGDTTFYSAKFFQNILRRLNGNHIFLRGSHDKWLAKNTLQIFEKKIEDNYIVVCHYAMRVWPRSNYGSWQLYGHSHGHLDPIGKQYDIGVDNNNFYPVSYEEIKLIMKDKSNNFMDNRLIDNRLI